MTPAQFGHLLERFRLRCSQQLDEITYRQAVAAQLKVSDREMRRWLNGATRIPGPIEIIAQWMVDNPHLRLDKIVQAQSHGSLKDLSAPELARLQSRLEATEAVAGFAHRRWNFRTDTIELDAQLATIAGMPSDIPINYQLWQNLMDPEDRPSVESMVGRAMCGDNRGIYDMRYRIIRPCDGAVRLVRSRGRCFFENGQLVELVAVILDVTPTSDINAVRLRQQQLQFSAALELACMGQYRFDLRTYTADWDIRTKQLFGLPLETRVPAWAVWRETIYPQDLPQHEAILAQAMQPSDHTIDGHATSYENRFRIVGFDGSHRNIGVRGHVNFLNSQPIDIVGVIRELA